MFLIYNFIFTAIFLFEANNVKCNEGFGWPLALQARSTGWAGPWFPHRPNEQDVNEEIDYKKTPDLYDPHHGIAMGIKDARCDNGKVNVEIDWDLNPVNYTCFDDKAMYLPRSDIHPIHTTEFIPEAYHAYHMCMNESIEYDRPIPTFGTHRPLWAQYGEYVFLPRQRWLHNLEHGAAVMLYHPCADKNEVHLLKKLIKMCLYRHIITPFTMLSPERPIALVTWGHLLEMSKVSPSVVIQFMRQHANQGPEKLSKDGQYTLMLLEHSQVVSDLDDTNICPFIN